MISRKLFSHRIWRASRTFSECEAWIDLIQSARFEATVTIERIGGRNISYGRGQYPASVSFLSQKWGWKSEKKVRNFLDVLRKEGMITTDCSQGMNIITLCNYDLYNTPKGKPEGEPKGKEDGKVNELTINDLNAALGELRASIGASVRAEVAKCLENLQKEGQGGGNNNKKDNNINNSSKETSTNVEEKKAEQAKKLAAARAATLERKKEFYDSLVHYVERYGKAMVRDFFDYWSELNKSETKMRFETNKTWEVAKRLATWAKKETFKPNSNARNRNSAPANPASSSGYGEL